MKRLASPPLELELEARGNATLVQRRAAAPLKPSKPQEACDIGLFGDDAAQLDLVEMLQDPTNGE